MHPTARGKSRELKADTNNEAQATGTDEVKVEECRSGPWGIQEEPVDREGETEANPDEAPADCSLPESEDFTLGRKTDLRLSPLEGIRLLPNIQTFDLPRLRISGSLIQPLVNLRLFDSLRFDIADAFPTLFGGITQELTRSLSVLDSLPPILYQLQFPNLSLEISQNLQSILEPILRPFPPLVHPKARMAAKLGWVIHHTLPTIVLEDATEEDLDEAIMTHYKERWTEFRKDIELATSRYLVDQDSKETMNQALSAHELGLYRLVPRAMVAEIERATRVQLHGKIVDRGLNIKETILSKVDDLPISSFHDLTSGTMEYETLEKHLYEHIDDENDRSKFAESPIPSRHATVHGLVPYASEKSSLNSIFLADFVFLMITQIKKEKITKVAEILKGYALAAESRQQEGSSFWEESSGLSC